MYFFLTIKLFECSFNPTGIRYNVSVAERRFNPRAILDDPNNLQPQNLTLLPGEETCAHIFFHVMVRPVIKELYAKSVCFYYYHYFSKNVRMIW